MNHIQTVHQEACMARLKMETQPYAESDLPQTKEATQLIDCETVFGRDNAVTCGMNPETGHYEVRMVGGPMAEYEVAMRNLCINMIFEAGREDLLMDAVHAAVDLLGTPKHVVDLLMMWAGFVPHDKQSMS